MRRKALTSLTALCLCVVLVWLALGFGSAGEVPGAAVSERESVRPGAGLVEGESRGERAADTGLRQVVAVERGPTDPPLLVLWVTRSDTREPVADALLRLMREDGRQPEIRMVRTDDQGVASVEDIVAGQVYVTPGGAAITVAPRGRTEHEVVLELFYEVRGVVVNAQGVPLAGATIWSADTNLSELGSAEIAVTGADGRFGWTSWSAYENVFATAAGFSASPVFDLYGTPADPPPELRIALRPAVGAVAGTVVDEVDHPVAGALVALTPPAAEPVEPAAEAGFFKAHNRRCPQRTAVTDDTGRFRFGDLAAGRAFVRVRSDMHGQSQQPFDVAPGTETTVRLVLGRPRIVQGRVLDDVGQAVSSAIVSFGSLGQFDRVVAQSNGQGDYALHGLPTEGVFISAFKQGYAGASAQAIARPVPTERFDFVLRRQHSHRGRLLDADGQPLAGWWVYEAHGNAGGSQTDTQGNFELRDVEGPAPELTGTEPMEGSPQRGHPPRPLRADPEREGELLLYRPAPGSELTAWIIGRLLLPDNAGDAPIRVELRSAHPAWRRSVRVADSGQFELGPVPPGTYEIEMEGDALPRQPLGTHVLAAYQRLDLGAITTRARVPFRAEVARADSRPVKWLRTTLRDADGTSWRIGYDAPALLKAEPLPPGRYELTIYAPDVQLQRVAFELVPGQPEHLQITLAGGQPVRFTATVPDGVPTPRRVRLDLEREGDRDTLRLELWWHQLTRSPEIFALGSGRYRCRAMSEGKLEGGLQGSARFVVAESAEPVEVLLELR